MPSQILREDVTDQWNEIGCHPGYISSDFRSVYLAERETELATLCDPRVRHTVELLRLALVSYADFPRRGHSASPEAQPWR